METIKESKSLVILSLDDLREVITSILDDYNNQDEEETYLTESEVKNLLHVTRPTLWRWHKSGFLSKLKFGAKVMYRKSDVDRLINQKY